jgi:Tfp pilus assembly protein PilN
VKLLDEISNLLPNGVWFQTMTVSGDNISIDGYGFTNTDIVSYVDNVKNSKIFTDVYLQESKSTELEKIPLYVFKLTFKINPSTLTTGYSPTLLRGAGYSQGAG